jgi:HEAT repeat protein
MSTILVVLAVVPGFVELQPVAQRLRPAQRQVADNTEESMLQAARLGTTDEALLDFFRKRIRTAPGREVIEKLAARLSSADPTEADGAQAELLRLGVAVVPVVREIANQVDQPEAASRARVILDLVEGPRAASLPIAVARLLAARQTAGAAELLLGYLPMADDDRVFDEIAGCLPAVAVRQGRTDPGLLAALKDSHPVRRGIAAQVLCQVGSLTDCRLVRPLLKDPESTVRLKAALALVGRNDAEAVPVLIALVADPSPLSSKQAEQGLIELAGEGAVSAPSGQGAVARQRQRDLWAHWWNKVADGAVLREILTRSLADDEIDRALILLGQLDHASPEVRESAERDLVALGPRATSYLRGAISRGQPRISSAAARCLSRIEGQRSNPLPSTALRLLQLRPPSGTTAALLAFLPCAEDEDMVGQIREVLVAVAVVDGKPAEHLVQALQDRFGVRRGVAAAVLCSTGRSEDVKVARNLLKDPDPAVRLKVALALARAGDASGVPTLIALVKDGPSEPAYQAEAYLERLAVTSRPTELLTETDSPKRAALWSDWYLANKDQVVLTNPYDPDVTSRYRGYTLLIPRQDNTISELGLDGKPRWTLAGLSGPRDAQMLPGQRILVAERNKVTERNLHGVVLWQKEVARPLSVQRLANGNTLIVCPNQLIEVNRGGQAILEAEVQNVVAARKLPDGQIVAFNRNEVLKLDKSGKILKTTPVDCGGAGCNEVLDNGHVLVSSPGNGNLIEFDADGQEVNRFNMPGVVHGYRLSNGHTLVTINGDRCVELDGKWRPVKEMTLPMPAFRVKGR